MPTYVYKFVDSGETIEVHQAFQDDTLTEIAHPDSGEVLPVKKVFTPVGVTFKGSGFFKTDNRGKKSATSSSHGDSSSKDGGSSDGGSNDSGSKDSGSKDSGSSSSESSSSSSESSQKSTTKTSDTKSTTSASSSSTAN